MKYVDEFRNAEIARLLSTRIRTRLPAGRTYKVMEVCGGHTHTIYRHGISDLLPPGIELIHGPGCPVCVMPTGRLDMAMHLARCPGVIFTCFGDMMRVPGSSGSLLELKAEGADVRLVYSPLDALRIARENPTRQVVFFAIGFETTAPSTALTLRRARLEKLANFTVFCNHVLIGPPLRALLQSPSTDLDGFIGPGHVSTVIGCRPYEFIPREFDKSVVVAGFEPLDVLQAIAMLVDQFASGRSAVENQYSRVVLWDGNVAAVAAMTEVFTVRPTFEWRGLGFIPGSGLRISDGYAEFDAERRFELPFVRAEDPMESECGDVLSGSLRPERCRAFGTACTPEHPLGALMVSSEGACAAYYTYGRARLEPAIT